MGLLTHKGTLEKPGSDFVACPRPVDARILEGSCPRCGSDLLCCYGDLGPVEFCDTYHHICMSSTCDFLEKADVYGTGMGGREGSGPGPCPFCGRAVR